MKCVQDGEHKDCPLDGDCIFLDIWKRVQKATSEIYDQTTMADLVAEQKARTKRFVLDFAI